MKKSIFAFCLTLGLAFGAENAFSLTKNYVQNISGADVPSAGGSGSTWPVYNVKIDCYPTYCALICEQDGFLACTWNNAFNRGACGGCDEDFFNAGNGQDMFDYATDQIIASVTSGTYINNIVPPTGPHYFRSITWSYNSVADEYNMTLTLTEVTP